MRTPIVVNPDAGAGRAAARARALAPRLEAALGPLEWCESRDAAHLTELVAESAQRGAPLVLVAGGDGTVHFAARGAAGTRTALGILPVGTGNDVAFAVGIPRDLEAAVDVIAQGHVRRIDAGEANGRLFECVLGVGMDTPALERINAARFLRRGRLLYSLAALRTLVTYRAQTVEIAWGEREDERWKGELVFAAVTNTRSYAGGMKISPRARVDDGLLDVCIVPRLGLARELASFRRVQEGTHEGLPGIVLAQGARVRISSERPLRATLDGELTDLTAPLDVKALPGALRVIGAPLALPRRTGERELATRTA
jgi:diacylglycerol kinase (ATP)